MAEKTTDQSGAGCLGTVFTVVGFLIFASAITAQIRTGGDFDADSGGAIIPGLVLMAMGRLVKRRAAERQPEKGRVQIPLKPPSTPRPQPSPAPPAPAGARPNRPVAPRPIETPPVVDVPELPRVEEVHAPGELPAVENLSLEDFEPDKPLSSEERIRIAKEKYRKKH